VVVSRARNDALDVLIVGAGPTGLTAGCLLARQGFSVRIVRKHKPYSGHSRATGIWARAMEILEPVGVVERLEPIANRITRLGYYSSGESIGCFDLNRVTDTKFGYLLAVSQHRTEAALEAAFLAAGGAIHDGEVTELWQGARQVTVAVDSAGHRSTMSASYLVGADGANSAVRNLLGIAMNDVGPTLAYRLADAVIDGLPGDQGNYCWTPGGGMGVVPHDGHAFRLAYRLTQDSPDPSLESFQRLLDARGPNSVRATIRTLISTSDFETRYAIAERFDVGRCALAGDAAHLMSPAGAQGMNSGILDAAALAECIEKALVNDEPDIAFAGYDAARKSAVRQIMAIVMEHSRSGSLKSETEIAERDRRYRDMAADPAAHLDWVTRLSQLHLDTSR
jgi:2-polyprenyl-6-methoxyphenol hydroxylase-like FAD-dependent oxidoreductase